MTAQTAKSQTKLAAVVGSLGVIAALTVVAVGGLFVSGSLSNGVSLFGSSSSTPDEWDPILETYIPFIEAERGLAFDHPVHLRFTDIAAEVAASFEEAREFDEQFDATNGIDAVDPYGDAFTLLGLVDFDPDLDSRETTEASIVENAGAFYDPVVEEIVLPEGESILRLQLTIVHELTHALQHQNGMLDFHPETSDSSQARLALIEGDAERIAEAWFAQLNREDQMAYIDSLDIGEETTFDDPGNSYLDATFFVSYGLGVPLVLSIIETDGEEELNRLLRSPDVGSTERFVDLLGNSDAQSVDAVAEFDPPAGRSEADGDLGALTWFAVLSPIVGTDGAFDALVGYDDDAFAIYENDAGTVCGRFEVFFDTAGDAAEFAMFLGEIGIDSSVDDARRSATSDVCEQVGDPDDQRIAVVFPLVVANELVLNHLLMGESEEIARCAALAQAKTLPFDQSLDDFVGYDALFVDSTSFVTTCR